MTPKLHITEPYPHDRKLTAEERVQDMLYMDEQAGFLGATKYLDASPSYTPYQDVKQFHKSFRHPIADTPTEMRKDRREKRFTWMLEELDEFKHADHLVDQIDALIDILYLTYGTLVELGVEPNAHFAHVHQANMRKLDRFGNPLYKEDGKIAKPEGWRGPEMDIARSLVLTSVEQFRENPMFSSLDLAGIRDLKRKYDHLQENYGKQLLSEVEAQAEKEAQQVNLNNLPLSIGISPMTRQGTGDPYGHLDHQGPRLT